MSRLIDAEHFEQMLIDLIDNGDHKNAYVHHAYKMRNIAIKECRNMLWEEPTVDAVPVEHGHWVDDGKFKYKHGGTGHEAKELFGTEWWTMERRKCSVCYKVSLVDDSILYGYCPHCGARMDEVTE